jgi:hypothetical protein
MSVFDVPTQDEIMRLAGVREPGCVSIYVQSVPGPEAWEMARTEVQARLRTAIDALEAAGTDAAAIHSLRTAIVGLLSNRVDWHRETRTLAIFANGTGLSIFHLADKLHNLTAVSDRFAITPLLRATTFAHSAFVLALSQNAVRLIDISPTHAAGEISVPDLPHDLKSTVALDLTNDRDTLAHLRTSEDPKERMLEFSRAIDHALRPLLAHSDRPLILAATEPLVSIYPSASSYPGLVHAVIAGNPEEQSAGELATKATSILDDAHAAELAVQTTRFHESTSRDLSDDTLNGVSVAATMKEIDTLFVDIDRRMPGSIDESTGVITLNEPDDESGYDVIDEIVRRALLSDAKIFAVRGAEVPGSSPVAAILRFAVYV